MRKIKNLREFDQKYFKNTFVIIVIYTDTQASSSCLSFVSLHTIVKQI